MSDTLITVVAVVLAAVLMFIFPLMSVAERGDDMSQLTVETATSEFVNKATSTGKITLTDYQELIDKIHSTGNVYDVDMEVKVLDENIGKKSAWTTGTVIGENQYYSVYTTQIYDTLKDEKSYKMKEGDIFSASVKNTSKTMAQTLRNAFYSITGNDSYQIAAQHSGVVQATSR